MRFEPITRYDLQLSIIIPVKDEAQKCGCIGKRDFKCALHALNVLAMYLDR